MIEMKNKRKRIIMGIDDWIDDRIDDWHNSDTNLELHEFLGMSWSEYAEWVKGTKNNQKIKKDSYKYPEINDLSNI